MISTLKIEEIADLIVNEILQEKTNSEIYRMEQDDIDAVLFPIIQTIEDTVDTKVSDAVSSAFRNSRSTRGKWWENPTT